MTNTDNNAPTVEGVDNRGDAEVPYGYVYFSDGVRVGFGDTRDGMGAFGLFGGQPGWERPKTVHFTLATQELNKLFPAIAAEYADKMNTEG